MKLSNNISFFYEHRKPVVAIALSLLALYFRLLWVARKAESGLIGDEIWQLGAMGGSLWDMIKSLPHQEHATFLSGDYFIIYPFFKMFGYNRWGIAFPHLVIAMIGFYYFYLISKRYFRTTWAYVIAFAILAFNVTLIEKSTMARTYAVLPTLALMILYYGQMLVDGNVHLSMKQKWGFGIFFVLALWFHVYGILIVFCTILYCLLGKFQDKSAKVIIVDMVKFFSIVFVIAMPFWLISVYGPHILPGVDLIDTRMNVLDYQFSDRNITTFDYIPNPLFDFIGFLKSIFGNLIGYRKFYILLPGVFIPFFLPVKNRYKLIGFLLALVALPLMLLLFSVLKSGYWFLQRQFVWVMPFFALFLAWSWDSLILFILKREQ